MCIMVYVKKVNGGFFEEIIQKVCPINMSCCVIIMMSQTVGALLRGLFTWRWGPQVGDVTRFAP